MAAPAARLAPLGRRPACPAPAHAARGARARGARVPRARARRTPQRGVARRTLAPAHVTGPHARGLGGRLLGGSALTLASSLLSRGIALVQSVVVARALDPRQIGVFAIVTYVLGLVAAFADLGLPTAAAKLLSEAQGGRGPLRQVVTTLAVAMLGVAGLAGLVLLAAAAPLAA
ncbi:MAG TPA: hypothetical protein DDZ42_08760, partial [Candidatus Rokubacteria bacterium]|nr:hypothetical protein [Candidatus Rokubacteria bacterium]